VLACGACNNKKQNYDLNHFWDNMRSSKLSSYYSVLFFEKWVKKNRLLNKSVANHKKDIYESILERKGNELFKRELNYLMNPLWILDELKKITMTKKLTYKKALIRIKKVDDYATPKSVSIWIKNRKAEGNRIRKELQRYFMSVNRLGILNKK
jgi:hypothetical protein